MSIRHRWVIVSLFVSLMAAGSTRADVSVGGLFSDHAVLQRDVPLPIWGTARPNEGVTVTLGDHKASTKADADGHWKVRLDPLPAGGPFEMTITGDNAITIADVVVGEVWICSGQSNMAWPVQRALNAEQEIASANDPGIRLLTVPRQPADEPSTGVGRPWRVCTSETVGDFSAVGYFFGRELHKTIKVAVGLIDSSVGGTPAEAWTPRPALEADPEFRPILERWEQRFAAAKAAAKQAATKGTEGKRAGSESNGSTQPEPRRGRNATNPASKPAPSLAELRKSPQRPAVLYNGMIHPLIPYAIRGAIWYQGESNARYAYQYRKLFPTMIREWRQKWGQGDFPFLFVQLANWRCCQTEPYQSAWAELREAQLMTLTLPRTGMAVTTDIGDPKDIHPKNKQEVGRRLALAARAVAYGEDLTYSGPLYASMATDGDRIRIRFTHTGGGLAARGGGAIKGFAIAGTDQKFVEAEAPIDGDSVLVHSAKVPQPVAVRYAWAEVPDDNLINTAALPASPFRTDDWPGVTHDAR